MVDISLVGNGSGEGANEEMFGWVTLRFRGFGRSPQRSGGKAVSQDGRCL